MLNYIVHDAKIQLYFYIASDILFFFAFFVLEQAQSGMVIGSRAMKNIVFA